MSIWTVREPSFTEMMQEPIIRAVMARDEVAEAELRLLLDRIREAIDERESLRRH
jgi:hypothetical protein